MKTDQPIAVGRCLVNLEYFRQWAPRPNSTSSTAGVRIMQPGSTDEGAYTPASDIFLLLTSASEAQRMAEFFSGVARKMQGIDQ